MNNPIPVSNNSENKREKIAKLLSEGNHSDKEIARLVGTSEGYVWKEKSKMKTAGVLISRNTEVISNTSQLNIYAAPTLVNLPPLGPVEFMKLYSEFRIGKKPAEIISVYGFHPDIVEFEYQRFLRLEEYDIHYLQRKFFEYFRHDLPAATKNPEVSLLIEKYEKDGKLGIYEFINLIRIMLNESNRLGRLSTIDDLTRGIAPHGWENEKCMNCNGPIRTCMLESSRGLRIIISDNKAVLTHTSFGFLCDKTNVAT
jgi:biotin operon repressor